MTSTLDSDQQPRTDAEARGLLTLSRRRAEIVDRLARQFGPSISKATIESIVERGFEGFATAPVRDFIPVLVEKSAYDKIRAMTR